MCIYICFLFPLLYYNYSCIYLYKGYASYIYISRGCVKHKRLRTTDLDESAASEGYTQWSEECSVVLADQLP
jgi:hypothetical protein